MNYTDPTGHFAFALAAFTLPALPAVVTAVVAAAAVVAVAYVAVEVGSAIYERTNGHHSWPKYLGGDPDQDLTTLDEQDHIQIHKDINEFAPRYKGKDFYDGLPADEKEAILDQLEEYYDENCPECAEDFRKQRYGDSGTPESSDDAGLPTD